MVQNIEQQAINTVRVLAADVVRGANSGHPGLFVGVTEKIRGGSYLSLTYT